MDTDSQDPRANGTGHARFRSDLVGLLAERAARAELVRSQRVALDDAARAARDGRLASTARRQQLRERRAWELEQARIEEVERTLRIVEATPAEAAEAEAAAAATMQQQDGAVVDVDGIVAETDRLFSALMSEM